MIWVMFAALTVLGLLVVLRPLIAQRTKTAAGDEVDIYRDQLAEIDNDLARGLISESEAEAARAEVKRRILAAPKREAARETLAAKKVALGVSAGVVLSSVALYVALGQPDLPDRPYSAEAARKAEVDSVVAQVDAMIATMTARLKANPNDVRGWRALGWTLLQIGRPKEGVAALERALAIEPKNADLRSQYAEGLVQVAEGKVTPDALKQFETALTQDPKDLRARYYRGLALAQGGQEKEALAMWVEVLREAPKDASWLPQIREQAQALALRLKLDPQKTLP